MWITRTARSVLDGMLDTPMPDAAWKNQEEFLDVFEERLKAEIKQAQEEILRVIPESVGAKSRGRPRKEMDV